MDKKEKEKKRLAKKLGGKVVDDPLFTDDDNGNVIWLTVEGNQESKSLIGKLKDKYDTHKDNKRQRLIEKGNSIVREADSLLSKQKYDDAIKYYQSAKEIFANQNYIEGCMLCDQSAKKCYYEKAQGLATKAKQYEINKQFSFAIELYSAASEVYKSGNFDEYSNKCDKCKNRCYERIGDNLFQQARDKFDNGNFDAANNLLAQAKTNYNTAGAFVKYKECVALNASYLILEGDKKYARAKSCKKYTDVVNFYTLALADYKKAGDAKKAKQCQADLGMYIFNLGSEMFADSKFDSALPYLQEALKHLDAVDDKSIKERCMMHLGDCFYENAKNIQLTKQYDKALEIYEKAKHYYELSNYDFALEICEKAISSLNNYKQNSMDDGIAYLRKADTNIKNQNYYSAAQNLTKAMDCFSRFEEHRPTWEVCKKLYGQCINSINSTYVTYNHISHNTNDDDTNNNEPTRPSIYGGYSEEERLQNGINAAVRDAEWLYNEGIKDYNNERFEEAKCWFDRAKDAYILLDTRNLVVEGVNLQDLELDNFRFEEEIKQCDAMFALCDVGIERKYQEERARDMGYDY